jgi:pyruvate kinase
MRRHRRAKIVATVGPSSASPAMLEKLFLAGVDTFRLNFSHGTHDDHAKVHASIGALDKLARWRAGEAGTERAKVHRGQPEAAN